MRKGKRHVFRADTFVLPTVPPKPQLGDIALDPKYWVVYRYTGLDAGWVPLQHLQPRDVFISHHPDDDRGRVSVYYRGRRALENFIPKLAEEIAELMRQNLKENK